MLMLIVMGILAWLAAGGVGLRLAIRRSYGNPEFKTWKGVLQMLAFGPPGLVAVLKFPTTDAMNLAAREVQLDRLEQAADEAMRKAERGEMLEMQPLSLNPSK